MPPIVSFPLGKTGGLIEAGTYSRYLAIKTPWFPLGKTGGLIEAGYGLSAIPSAMTKFPLGKTGGLIEASRTTLMAGILARFPLGKTGGLIEASGRTWRPPARCWRFRWVKPAASLKRPVLPAVVRLYRLCFRWVKPAASLKP